MNEEDIFKDKYTPKENKPMVFWIHISSIWNWFKKRKNYKKTRRKK